MQPTIVVLIGMNKRLKRPKAIWISVHFLVKDLLINLFMKDLLMNKQNMV